MEKIINNSVLARLLPKRWHKRIFEQFLLRISSEYVEGTAESSDLLRKIYPPQVYDPIRRDMAIEVSGKEIAKIIDAKDNHELRRIRRSVANMYDSREDVYAPFHDFWSFIEMVLHIKKKELPELITASNVRWSIKEMALEELQMSWMPFLERNPDIFGSKPWRISDLQKVFSDSPDILKEAKQDQIDIIGKQQHKFKQSHEPITIIDRGNGYEIVDGNGRLYHAVLNRRKTIRCYVGILEGKSPVGYWVSSGSIKQLCLEIRGFKETDTQGYEAGLTYLHTKLRNNRTALANYQLYLRNDFPEYETALHDVLPPKSPNRAT